MLFSRARLILTATIAVGVVVVPTAGQGHVVKLNGATTLGVGEGSECLEIFKVADYQSYAKSVYERKTVSFRAHRRLDRMHRCQHSWKARKRVSTLHKKFKAEREQRQASEACTQFGEWAIPGYIVMRESKGKNVPEASGASDASGFYQILDSTWIGAGGTDRNVNYQAMHAPKSEQDCVAHRLWNNGNNNHWALTR